MLFFNLTAIIFIPTRSNWWKNVGEFSWSGILKDCNQVQREKEKFVVVCLRPLLSVAQGRFVVMAKKFIRKSILHVQIWSFSRKTFSFYEVPSTGIRPDISLRNRIYILLISSPKPLSRVIFRDLTELRVGVDDWNRIIAVSSASCPNSCVRGLLFSLLFSGCWRC